MREAPVIALCLRRNVLGPHASAPDQIDAIFAAIARYRVDERQRLDGETEPQELLLERLEPLQLVAHRRRALELQPVACGFHLVSECRDRPIVVSVEKRSRERDALEIFVLRTSANAWPETLLDLVANAAGCARDLEELSLIGEMHARVQRAVAQREHI